MKRDRTVLEKPQTHPCWMSPKGSTKYIHRKDLGVRDHLRELTLDRPTEK